MRSKALVGMGGGVGPSDRDREPAGGSGSADSYRLLIKPMLAESREIPFDSEEHVFELKWDGTRAIAFVRYGQRFQNRRLTFIEHRYPEIRPRTREDAILDGEIVVMDAGRPSFAKLQEREHTGAELREAPRARAQGRPDPDRLPGEDDARDVRRVRRPLRGRPGDQVEAPPRAEGDPPRPRHRRRACRPERLHPDPRGGLLRRGPCAGPRGDHREAGDEPVQARDPEVGLGQDREENDPRLRGLRDHGGGGGAERHVRLPDPRCLPRGPARPHRAGSGRDSPRRAAGRSTRGSTRSRPPCPFDEEPEILDARLAFWTRPEVLAEVHFLEFSKDRRLRAPTFAGLREDKDPRDCTVTPPE